MIATMVIIAIGVSRSYGQQADSIKKKSDIYLSHLLKIDTATAHQVNDVHDNYKKAVRQVISNGSLTEPQKRAAIDLLIDEKNRRLEQILPADQRNQIIPTTERRALKADTTVKRNH